MAVAPLFIAAGCLVFPVEPKPQPIVINPLPREEAPSGLTELRDIKSALNLAEKTIILATTAPVKYSSYMLEKPPRVAVEMRHTASRIPSPSMMVDDDLVEKITVFEFKKAGVARVEILLKRSAQYAVITADNGIEIKIYPLEEHKDPAILAKRLMEAEARAEALAEENEGLKSMLAGKQNEPPAASHEPKAAPQERVRPTGWEELSAQPGWRDRAKRDILAVLERWRKSQEDRDFSAYSILYSAGFHQDGLGLEQWLESAKARFAEFPRQEVRVFRRYVKISESSARVDFSAQYLPKEGPRGKETLAKAITLSWAPDGWKIESETGAAKPAR